MAQGVIPYGAQILIALGVAKSLGVTIPVNALLATLYYPMVLAVGIVIFILRGSASRNKVQKGK